MLTLALKSPLPLPIDVDSVLPENIASTTTTQIGNRLIWCGRHQQPLKDFFDIYGTAREDATIRWRGCSDGTGLARVNRIGYRMISGTMLIHGAAGIHTGWQMQGGRIEVLGNADDYLGAEMTGGTIIVSGDAGNHVGSRFNGKKIGMNRGQIFIQGSAGHGLGQGMRRGTIVVGKQAGKLVGWNMLAGTIFCLQGCGPYPGAGMKRGTIIAAANPDSAAILQENNWILPSFTPGSTHNVPIFRPFKIWLATQVLDGQPLFSTTQTDLLNQTYQVFHGDRLNNGRGEIFLVSEKTS